MLYRPTPRFQIKARACTMFHVIAGTFDELATRRADAAYLDRLDTAALRDLGLTRIETRDGGRYF